MDKLDNEMWQAVARVKMPHIDRLLSLGCTPAALANLGAVQPPFGVGAVQWVSGGLYEPSEAGEPAVIMPVFDDTDMGFRATDLIAWRTSSPRRWAARLGTALALGDYLLDEADIVRVVETPLDWLAAGGNALCVLDWDAPGCFWARVRSGPRLVVPNASLKAKIATACSRSVRMPEMEVLVA